MLSGRHDTGYIIQAASSTAGSVGIAVCGPEEMVYNVREAASSAQRKIFHRKRPDGNLSPRRRIFVSSSSDVMSAASIVDGDEI